MQRSCLWFRLFRDHHIDQIRVGRLNPKSNPSDIDGRKTSPRGVPGRSAIIGIDDAFSPFGRKETRCAAGRRRSRHTAKDAVVYAPPFKCVACAWDPPIESAGRSPNNAFSIVGVDG
jgi:hypothetical protein